MPKPSAKRSAEKPASGLKPIPKFASEAEEREFWKTHDSTEYVDWSQARRVVLYNLAKSPQQAISIRLPTALIGELKHLAAHKRIPYQTLVKMWLGERVNQELAALSPTPTPTARKKRKTG
jgi:predicted DNA binding CopG/RHH family protein